MIVTRHILRRVNKELIMISLLVILCSITCVLEGREHTAQQYLYIRPVFQIQKRSAVKYIKAQTNNFDKDNSNQKESNYNCSVIIDKTKHEEKHGYNKPAESYKEDFNETNNQNNSVKIIKAEHAKKHNYDGPEENVAVRSNVENDYSEIKSFENKHYQDNLMNNFEKNPDKKDDYDIPMQSSSKKHNHYYKIGNVKESPDVSNYQINNETNSEKLQKPNELDNEKEHIRSGPMQDSETKDDYYYDPDNIKKSPDIKYNQINKIINFKKVLKQTNPNNYKERVFNSPTNSTGEKNTHYYESNNAEESPEVNDYQINDIINFIKLYEDPEADNNEEHTFNSPIRSSNETDNQYYKGDDVKELPNAKDNPINDIINLQKVYKQSEPGNGNGNKPLKIFGKKYNHYYKTDNVEESHNADSNQIDDIINLKSIFNQIKSDDDKGHVTNGSIKSFEEKHNNYDDTVYFNELPNAEDNQNFDKKSLQKVNIQTEPDNYKEKHHPNDQENYFFYRNKNKQSNTKPDFRNYAFDKKNTAKNQLAEIMTRYKSNLNNELDSVIKSKTQKIHDIAKSASYQVMENFSDKFDKFVAILDENIKLIANAAKQMYLHEDHYLALSNWLKTRNNFGNYLRKLEIYLKMLKKYINNLMITINEYTDANEDKNLRTTYYKYIHAARKIKNNLNTIIDNIKLDINYIDNMKGKY